MTKYILATNTGHGFISHEDQEQNGLKFNGRAGDIMEVTGDEAQINTWATRVGGVEKTEVEALALIKKVEDANKKARKLELEDELKKL